MKKMICLIFVLLFLAGCGAQPQEQSVQTQTTSEATQLSEPITEDETKPIKSEQEQEYEKWLEEITNPLDGEGMIPLLFVNASADASRAYLLCAGSNGEVYLADRFTYDGAPLYTVDDQVIGGGRLEDQDKVSTTKIFDVNKPLQFIDIFGKLTENTAVKMTTTGRVFDSFVMAQVHLKTKENSQFCLGTYADVQMFPADAVYGENSISADLDGNGIEDCVSWAFTEDEYVEIDFLDYSGYLYDYEIVVLLNGQEYRIGSYADYSRVSQDDFQIFLADVNQDGDYEIVSYMKESLRFDSVTVWDFDGNTYTDLLTYVITPWP